MLGLGLAKAQEGVRVSQGSGGLGLGSGLGLGLAKAPRAGAPGGDTVRHQPPRVGIGGVAAVRLRVAAGEQPVPLNPCLCMRGGRALPAYLLEVEAVGTHGRPSLKGGGAAHARKGLATAHSTHSAHSTRATHSTHTGRSAAAAAATAATTAASTAAAAAATDGEADGDGDVEADAHLECHPDANVIAAAAAAGSSVLDQRCRPIKGIGVVIAVVVVIIGFVEAVQHVTYPPLQYTTQ
eukprot:scaffold69576_cov45-Phaeocystis_antarctica.AAC.2